MERYLTGVKYAKGGAGEVPRWFLDGLKGIDDRLDVVQHPYQVMYDDIINQYSGSQEDPRFTVGWWGANRLFGYPLKQTETDQPAEDGRWHVWRWCWPHGWAHVGVLDVPTEQMTSSIGEEYLRKWLHLLWVEAKLSAKGKTAYREHLVNEQEQIQAKALSDKQNRFEDVKSENSGFLRKAMENFERGDYKPTNPMKESIVSYSGQVKRSKTSRPLTDEEGGLYVPED